MIPLANGRAAWECPACLTFNFAEESRCLVCDPTQGDFTKMATKTKAARKTKTAKKKAPMHGTGMWKPDEWDACHQIQKPLGGLGVPIPLDEIKAWSDDDREEVSAWTDAMQRNLPCRLPDVLAGKLPRGWKRPALEAKPPTPPAKKTKSNPDLKKDAGPDLRQIPVVEICPSDANPRKHFDEAALKQLAASLKREGQLQNLVVYEHPERVGWEIIAGERRWRAAKLAKLNSLTCKVVDVTEEEAMQMRGLENEDRENFSAFELARWYQQLNEHCGMSQRAIAKFAGISQGQVGNTLALLKLPEEWEQKVNTQEITPTCLRHLAPWSHRPQVLEAVAMGVKDRADDDEVTVDEFRKIVDQAARQQSRAMDGFASGPLFKVTQQRREELDVEDVPTSWGGKDPRAFNTTLYDKLQREAKKKQREKQKKNQGEREKAAATKKPEGPSEHQLQNFWLDWYRVAFAERLRKKLTKPQRAAMLRFVICLQLRNTESCDLVVSGWTGKTVWTGGPEWIAELEPDAFEQGFIEHLPGVLEDDRVYWDGDEIGVFERFAPLLGVDPSRDWEPEYEWLNLLTPEQLRRLPAAEWVPVEYFGSLEKADLIERLLEKWPKGNGVPKIFRLPEGGA